MMVIVDDFTAFVLAGGKSTRMGADKTLLELKGRSLLGRALDLLRPLTPETIIVGDREKLARFGFVVEDVFRERGPLGGIHAALAATATDLNLILAVDLPFVEAGFLKYLLKKASTSGALVTLPRTSNGWQPLCAVYRREFGIAAERALLQGKNKIDALFATTEVQPIDEDEITKRGYSAAMFRNLNTPEEFALAKRQRTLDAKSHRGPDA
jgi:molybdenum cofactor guanylyltransferase